MQQATARQPDETICFSCGNTVKRDAGTCTYCGSRIAAGPPQGASPSFQAAPTIAGQSTSTVVDEAGPGRYVLNFFLAGLIGVGLTYVMRKQGWMATYISGAIFVLVVAFIVMRG